MKQYDVNVRLAEEINKTNGELDSFEKEAADIMYSTLETMQIMNRIIEYERRIQHRTNIAHAVAIILTNIALILAVLKGVI